LYYTIYRTTNKINSKIYIGKHETDNPYDSYLGSGKAIKRAVKKYGADNFSKEVLFIFDNEHDMVVKEAELVTEEFCQLKSNYNLCPGGKGGFGYINSNTTSSDRRSRIKPTSLEALKIGRKTLIDKLQSDKEFNIAFKEKCSIGVKNYFKKHDHNWIGKSHKESSKIKISEAMVGKQAGKLNSQFGTMWVNNGQTSMKINKLDNIPNGWYKGRKLYK
jgi:hypothetical protein